VPTLVITNISNSMQREGLNHKWLSSSHSHDNVIRFITVLAADHWPVNSYHSNGVTNNPNGTMKIPSQFTEVYPDNRTLQVIEVSVSLTKYVLRAVVITDTEENIICRISTHSHSVSGYWSTGAWYTGYREFNWKHSPDARQATLPHTTSHAREGVGKTSFNSPICLITKDPKQANRSTNFLRPFLYCCFLMKV